MQKFDAQWAACIEKMGDMLNKVSLDVWIDPLIPIEYGQGVAYFYTESEFQREIALSRYNELIINLLSEQLGESISLCIYTEEDRPAELEIPSKNKKVKAAEDIEDKIKDTSAQSEILPMQGYTFDSFVVGNSNRFAHAAAIAVASTPSYAYNPLFIYGDSGLGKTHLLYAIQNEVIKRHPSFKILYLSTEEFSNDLITHIKKADMAAFRAKYRSADLLLLDDVQFLGTGDKKSTQEEVFHTFNTLYNAQKQIVLVSDRPPKEISLLDERLRTRFEGGLIADIQTPDFELRIAIIERKSEQLKLTLPDEVAQYIATKLKHNIRQIEGVLKKILAFSLLTKIKPNITIAQSAIRDVLNENEPTVVTLDRILTEVSRFYTVSVEEIKGKKRTAEITHARQVAMYIVREITKLSLPQIGEEFGKRDHSTVHYAISKIEEEMQNNYGFKDIVNTLIKNIKDKSS